ncbi:hypothetical protein GCM10010302_33750 [Streptomyces polychromogenes]|uniref:Uncharacterized protein n=1 Tax=Streptomyces polychromogenes TaxID=67342 RepID=A0ABN0VE53_9ACTN
MYASGPPERRATAVVTRFAPPGVQVRILLLHSGEGRGPVIAREVLRVTGLRGRAPKCGRRLVP